MEHIVTTEGGRIRGYERGNMIECFFRTSFIISSSSFYVYKASPSTSDILARLMPNVNSYSVFIKFSYSGVFLHTITVGG